MEERGKPNIVLDAVIQHNKTGKDHAREELTSVIEYKPIQRIKQITRM